MCTQSIEVMKTTKCVGITEIVVDEHLIDTLVGVRPLHLVGIGNHQITILDGMESIVPSAHGVNFSRPRTCSHFLVVVADIVRYSVIGGKVGLRHIAIWQHEIGIVEHATGKVGILIHCRDVLVVLVSRFEEVVA